MSFLNNKTINRHSDGCECHDGFKVLHFLISSITIYLGMKVLRKKQNKYFVTQFKFSINQIASIHIKFNTTKNNFTYLRVS